ncbi:MAG: PilZ domain-containing protein [Myxococcota bacterium]
MLPRVDDPCYEVDLSDRDRLRHARAHNLAAGGLRVVASDDPPLLSTVRVRVRLPRGEDTTLDGRVVNRAPAGDGFFVHFEPGSGLDGLLGAIDRALEAPEHPGGDDGDGEETRDGRPPPLSAASTHTAAWELIDPASHVPLHKQVSDLPVNDRIRLARRANRPVRRLLARDIEKRVHLGVVKNPKVKLDEIAEFSRMAGLSAVALEWLASQGRYTRRRDILMNLVLNPSTPGRTARKLLDRLNQRELIRVLRSPRAKEPIKREVKRRLMKAGVI